jgi:dTDP-L-rhamnose 4-epimerase
MNILITAFFKVFGRRQALSNPYTGVLAMLASRLPNNRPPLASRPPSIFEVGLQRRHFVSALDVVQACRLALAVPDATGRAFNIGSGRCYPVRQVAEWVRDRTADDRAGDARRERATRGLAA